MITLRRALIFLLALATILLFLLATAAGNNTVFAQYYGALVVLNIAATLGLAGLVGAKLWRLRQQVGLRTFGSRLAWRMTLMFALVAVMPGALVYTLSVQFLTKSIETWFDVRVDSALDKGLSLGNRALEYSGEELKKKADGMAAELSSGGNSDLLTRLNRLRENASVHEATLFDRRGRIIVHVGSESANPVPQMPERRILKQVLLQIPFRTLESTPNYGLALRVLVPVNPSWYGDETRVLQLIQPVPKDLAADAELVNQVRDAYRQLAISRNSLKHIYGLTLTLALLMALLGAVALGMYLSEKLSAPLNVLAAGTRAVAQGDFSTVQPIVSRDELGILTHSFNRMTRQLAEAREQLERQAQEQAQAKAYLETVLGSLTAGVIALDPRWRLRSANVSAEQILHADLDLLAGLALSEWGEQDAHLADFADAVQQAFIDASGEWQRQIELPLESGRRVLLVRGTRLPEGAAGAVLVFDDMTDVLRAQRDAAWGEVAKRLAHEIRNPLTPIQLAAERLEFKLADRLDEQGGEILRRSTQTIISQVGALKQMVDAFREYARQPSTKLAPLDLRALLDEVLVLYETAPVTREGWSDDLPMIMGDATQLRQVAHNLLKNAQEALAGSPDGQIRVRLQRCGKNLRLSVDDNGPGFDDAILQRIFEPYATTKSKGTGLGLPVVKKIVDEHRGSIVASNLSPHGASVRIDFPVAEAATMPPTATEENTRGE
jgi:nitrogen fixation/metabolism regulation signal transduction histidine kinase